MDAPVTLVEYGDFQCPYCGDAYPVVKDLVERFGDRLRFVFRHMPLADLHPRAPAAAEAAEAAATQGRFWDMHDRLFEHQLELSDAELREHAAAIGLDVERFDAELDEGVHAARVEQDYRQRGAQRDAEHAALLRQRRDAPGLALVSGALRADRDRAVSETGLASPGSGAAAGRSPASDRAPRAR